jgi:serine/threonine-protein kinase
MSYYPGESLKDCPNAQRGLPVEQAIGIASQRVARGLACAANLHPPRPQAGNVMLTPDGTAKILDFGLAKARDQTMTASGVVMGTVAYMSPEQLVGVPADARSDLWSLGVMLVEMLTGRHPSIVDDPSATLARQIEATSKDLIGPVSITALVRLVERLMRRDPTSGTGAAEMARHRALAQPSSAGVSATARLAGAPLTRVALGIGATALVIAGALGIADGRIALARRTRHEPASTGKLQTFVSRLAVQVTPVAIRVLR